MSLKLTIVLITIVIKKRNAINDAYKEATIELSPYFHTWVKLMKLTIDNSVLERYEKYYFSIHKKAHKKPIQNPYHESINVWMIMQRAAMNNLKQKWKDFMVWFVDDQGYSNLHIEKCEMYFFTYYGNNRRHDNDNSVPKFILDGFVESGLVIDDDNKHITRISLESGTDIDNPRTDILINILN